MPRTLTETHVYTPQQLEDLAQTMAKASIIGSFYTGCFSGQIVEWLPDGSLRVHTTHTPDRR